jgi:2-methylcitrate dehydratase MmgE/PrpD-like protein
LRDNAPVTWCEDVGSWAAALSLADVPRRARERARLQTASILAGARAGERAAAPFAAVAGDGPLGEIYAGAAASIAHDWDDYLFMGHTGHSAVWVARAFAGEDPDRALTAQIAGNEIGGRIGAALFLGPHNGQFWSSIHCGSAAAAAGVALGLDAERIAHALAIALYQPPYGLWPGFMGPDSKLLTAAEPAVQGARAALLAAEGVTGALDVVEDRRGLLAHFSFAPRPLMLGGLGSVWLTDTLAFKPRPGCAYLQAPVELVLGLGIKGAEVEAVEVDAGYLTVGMESLGARAGLTPIGVTFSAARSVAVALTAGRLTHEELAPEWLAAHASEVESLAARVKLRHDWAMTLETLRGTVDAGASVRDVPPRGWPRVLRRMRELGMDEASLSGGDLRALANDRSARRELWRLLSRRGGREGIEGIDTGAMRLAFPCRVRVRLFSGEVLSASGAEPGAGGAPLDEQREVVFAKCAAVGAEAGSLISVR